MERLNLREAAPAVITDACVHLTYNSWKCYQLEAGQLQPGQTVQYSKAGGMDRTSSKVHTLLGHSSPASQASRPVGPAQ